MDESAKQRSTGNVVAISSGGAVLIVIRVIDKIDKHSAIVITLLISIFYSVNINHICRFNWTSNFMIL